MALSEVSGDTEEESRAAWSAVAAAARETMIDVKGMCRDYYVPKTIKQERTA